MTMLTNVPLFLDPLYISALCHGNLECSAWTFEEHLETQTYDCSLLTSCQPKYNISSYPTITNSGLKTCQPEAFKRRKCTPACPSDRKFCHGRCLYGGRACYFAPCSRSPYREDTEDICSKLVIEVAEEDCQCNNIATNSEADICQTCIEDQLTSLNASQCLDLSGSPCWRCALSVTQKLDSCTQNHQNSSEIITCIEQKHDPECRVCVCTLLCYFSPSGSLCRHCLSQTALSALFLNSDRYVTK